MQGAQGAASLLLPLTTYPQHLPFISDRHKRNAPFTSGVTQSILRSYSEGLILYDSIPVPIAQCLLHPRYYGGIVRQVFQDIVGTGFMGRRLFAKGSRLFTKRR